MTNDSRRRFLTRGAMAAVGAIASAVAPKTADAAAPGPQGCLPPPLGGVTYYPNDGLAQAILRAWTDSVYRGKLLSYGPDPAVDFTKQQPSYTNTSLALAEVGVHITQPIVMTVAQYAGFKTFIQGGGKAPPGVLFVLPDTLGNLYTMDTARVAMTVTCNGM
jgi:hypothetical protein